MPHYLSPQQGIKEQVGILEERLEALGNKMRASPDRLRVDASYLIPFRDQAEVDETKGITVTPLDGSEALQRVIYGLTSTRIEPGKQNPRETLRVPAVLALPRDWLHELVELNGVRQEIERLAGEIEEQYERSKAWASMRYLSSLQVIRQTWIVSGPARIRFYWDASPSVQNKTAADWIKVYTKHLKKLHGYVPAIGELPEGDNSRKFVEAITSLSGISPRERIAAFRPGQPHVRARVSFIGTEPKALRPSPTPIVYPIDDPVPFIVPLSSYEAGELSEKKWSRTKIDLEPFVESMYLHRYLKQYRFSK
ncbi:DNA replication terminus site-binding protein [Pseudomonas sp. P108]|uniref:DNA replication terminus site-binding protein n=1 Tax=Pseudomonas sp. P108 TaxID=1837993 RepID=UPI002934932B|nr:DNA replication terminus site-binding protein [Pseudomonas sp. P108]WNZ87416.1 DNA replication terminus site-binding protein [Pseudomonas sp. P108]